MDIIRKLVIIEIILRMIAHKIPRLFQYVRKEYEPCTNLCLNRLNKICIRQSFAKRDASNTSPTQSRASFWQSFVGKWEWSVPVGVGVSLLAVLQWRHLRKHPYTAKENNDYEAIDNFMVKLYFYLPLRVASRICGWIASIQLPISWRPTLYGFYAKTFHANLEEIELDLSTFPTFVDFFVRPLKHGIRPIAQDSNLVSPADGTILSSGPVTSCKVEQVKGVTYNLRHFLGDIPSVSSEKENKYTKEDDDAYVKSLLKNPDNQLYQLSIYLAPGDYHRFHSATDWEIEYRKHYQGKLFSVNPKICKYLPDLLALNERVIYVGKWTGGFMAYTAVGATNVGSIKVYCDKDLHTNTIKWPEAEQWKDADLGCTRITKGQMFGEFRMGSTVVLLFEAPKDFQFSMKIGQRVKVGEGLTMCNVVDEEKEAKQGSS